MRILCFGDSNTYGYDPRSYFGGRYGPEERWVDLLSGLCGAECVNLGSNGRSIPRPGAGHRSFAAGVADAVRNAFNIKEV